MGYANFQANGIISYMKKKGYANYQAKIGSFLNQTKWAMLTVKQKW